MSTSPAPRYRAIDVLRGMTVALMIVVNMSLNETLSFAPLLHSAWDGFTLTDAVFPTFLFVVGASLAFTAERYAREGAAAYARRIGNRSLRIFLCGLVVSNFPFFTIVHGHIVVQPIETIRIMGVLQRIALAYLLAAGLLYRVSWRGVLAYSAAALIGAELVAQFGGDHSLTGNAAARIDYALLGAGHRYQLEGAPFDPEGLLGTIPASVNLLAGYLATRFLRHRAAIGASRGSGGIVTRDLLAMTGVGLALMIGALMLKTGIPINKKLWSISYTLLTIGIDVVLLAAMVQIVDRWSVRAGTTYFEIFGKNALVVYMVAELAMNLGWTLHIGATPLLRWIYDIGFAWIGGKTASLVYALAFTQACWMLAWFLDRRRIYVRL